MPQPKFMPKITKDDFYAGNFPAEVKDQEDGAVIIPAKMAVVTGRITWTVPEISPARTATNSFPMT